MTGLHREMTNTCKQNDVENDSKRNATKRMIIRTHYGSYENVCRFLCEAMGYELMDIIPDEGGGRAIESKWESFCRALKSIVPLLQRLEDIRLADELLLNASHYVCVLIMLFNKLHLIRPRKIYWWGFFFHSKRAIRLVSVILRAVYADNVAFILFSKCEKELYCQKMGIDDRAFVSVSYGSWEKINTQPVCRDSAGLPFDEYYFAGGYSNRDYKTLLQIWENKLSDKNLVIIGSRNNKELNEYLINKRQHPNKRIKILLDADSEKFDRYLMNAKACILPFKANTGASGQSVTLRCMRLNMLILSTDTEIMREYVVNGVTGLLMNNVEEQLPKAIDFIEKDPQIVKKMLEGQRILYEREFSYEAVTKKLIAVLGKE